MSSATLPTLARSPSRLDKLRGRLAKGHPLWGYLYGLWLRRQFDSAGILAIERGWPLPWVKNDQGQIHAENLLLFPGTRMWAHKGGVIRIGNGTYLNRGAEVIAWELHRKRLEWAKKEDIPFGRMLSNAAVGANSANPLRLAQIDTPAATWALIDTDQVAVNNPANTWYAQLPRIPVHCSVRNASFFDSHVEARKVRGPGTLF